MFSESELAFLAFVSFVIVFLGCIMLGRGRIDSSAGRRPDEKKIKGVPATIVVTVSTTKGEGQRKTTTTNLTIVAAKAAAITVLML